MKGKRRKSYREYRPSRRRRDREAVSFKSNTGVKIVICAMIIVAALFIKNSSDPFLSKIKDGLEKSINTSITPKDVAVFFEEVGDTYDSFKEQAKAVFAPVSGQDDSDSQAKPQSYTGSNQSLEDFESVFSAVIPAVEESSKTIKVITTEYDTLLTDPDAIEDYDSNAVRTDMPAKVETRLLSIPFSLVWPVTGEITSPFGMRVNPITNKNAFHYGIDIAASLGTKIAAVCDGTVKKVGYNSAYGNYLYLSHGEGYESFYAHLSKVSVKTGQKVNKGESIGKVGATGWATGSHLHFELHHEDKVLSPTDYLMA